MKIKDLFSLSKDFSKITYLAGENGGERDILYVDILELPDGMYWVEEGDFIVTMGYFFTTSNVKFENFIRILIQNKAAGLAVKLGRFFDEIPENALKLAQDNNFPIINFPLNMRYKAITVPILNKIISEEAYVNSTLAEYKKGLEMLLANSCEIKEIMEQIKRYIGCEIFLVWEHTNYYIYKSTDKFTREVVNTLEKNKAKIAVSKSMLKVATPVGDFIYYSVGDGKNILAYLCIIERKDRPFNEVDSLIIKETILHIVVYLYTSTRLRQSDTSSQDNFIIEILEGEYLRNEALLLSKAKKLKVPVRAARLCAGLNIEHFDTVQSDRIYRKVEMYFKLFNIDHVIYLNNYRIYFLINTKKEMPLSQLYKHFDLLVQDIKSSFYLDSICLCVSHLYECLQDLPNAFDEVKYLLEKDDTSLKNICYYEDFILENILDDIRTQSSTLRAGKAFLDKLDVLEQADKEDMLKTLKHLSENDFNLTQTAQAMFLHRNTLYKRMQKLEKLLSISFENSDNKLMIKLVAKVLEL